MTDIADTENRLKQIDGFWIDRRSAALWIPFKLRQLPIVEFDARLVDSAGLTKLLGIESHGVFSFVGQAPSSLPLRQWTGEMAR